MINSVEKDGLQSPTTDLLLNWNVFDKLDWPWLHWTSVCCNADNSCKKCEIVHCKCNYNVAIQVPCTWHSQCANRNFFVESKGIRIGFTFKAIMRRMWTKTFIYSIGTGTQTHNETALCYITLKFHYNVMAFKNPKDFIVNFFKIYSQI